MTYGSNEFIVTYGAREAAGRPPDRKDPMDATRIPYRTLALPAFVVALSAFAVLYAIAFDQGALASVVTDIGHGSGGLLHELFHDGRHLLGIPCH